jgi:hypothetical protein
MTSESRHDLIDHTGDFLDAAADAGAALGHMAKDLAAIVSGGIAARRVRRARAGGIPTGDVPPEDEISLGDAVDFMAQAFDEVQSQPANLSQDGRKISQVVNAFMDKHMDTPGVDLDGYYGPQSPDLVTLYVREFQPGWIYKLGAASSLWHNPDALPAGFAQVSDIRQAMRGDVCATNATGREPFGNMGVVVDANGAETDVLTQITGRGVGIVTYDRRDLRLFRWVGVSADA